MPAVTELRNYLHEYGSARLVSNLARRGVQHTRYRVCAVTGRRPTFAYQGAELEHFWHPYNRTWLSERALEIAISQHFLARFPNDATFAMPEDPGVEKRVEIR